MNFFLQDVANYLYQKNDGDFRNTTLVFPNRRARLFFNHFIATQTQKPLWAPRYSTITDFVQQLSGLLLADPLTLLFKLYKVFKEVTRSNESFDSLFFFIETILADFDDIDKYQVQAEKLFTNLSNIKDIEDFTDYLTDEQLQYISEFWDICVGAKQSDEKKDFISLWGVLHSIYKKFGENIEAENIAYEGRLYLRALQHLDSGDADDDFKRQIVFVGFNALNRSEEILFKTFSKYGNALFFWDYSEHYMQNKLHEAGFFLRDYIKRFPPPPDFTVSEHSTKNNQNIYTLAVPSNISQAKVIKKGLELTGSQTITTPLQTALVMADENLLLPVVNSLPNSIENVNISMGYPITDTSIYSLLVSLSELQRNRRKKTGGGYLFYHLDFFKVFQHEVLRDITELDDFKSFCTDCRKYNRVYIDIEEVVGDNVLLSALFTPLDNARNFVSYVRNIIELLVQKLLQGGAESKRILWETEIYHGIHKVLLRYEALLEEVDIEMNFATITRLFRKVLQGLSVPFSGEPLEGLQVTGILETRTLDFENLIILSMNEGKFPKTTGVPSLVPYTLRKGFGLPTQEHQDAIFAYYFYRLLHRARNVVLVYNIKTEGLQKGEPSRFIQQIKYTTDHSVQEVSMGYRISPNTDRALTASSQSFIQDKLSKYWAGYSKSYLSPSALTSYLQCRLKFYFRYVQAIQEPDQITENIESDIFGSILHKAIDLMYRDFEGQTVSSNQVEIILKNQKLINEAIDKAYAEEYFHNAPTLEYKGLELITREVIKQYLVRILEYDRLHTPFTIHSLEKQYTCTLNIPDVGHKIRVGGKIDRFDEFKGNYRVIDYKTGGKKNTFKTLESLFQFDSDLTLSAAFQSMMYAWLMVQHKNTQTIQPHLFFVREMDSAETDTRIYNSQKGAGVVDTMELYSAEFGERLMQLVTSIYDPDQPFIQTTNTKTCKYCSYKGICQRNEE